jgi:hypothetical protein
MKETAGLTTTNISLSEKFLVLLVMAFPFVNIAYIFAPLEVFGKNLWLVGSMAVAAMLYVLTWIRPGRIIFFERTDFGFAVLSVLFVLIFLTRELVYAEQLSVFGYRYVFVAFLLLLLLKRSVTGSGNVHLLVWSVVIACLLQAAIGILHSHVFPSVNIVINPEDPKDIQLLFDSERTREGGTLGASIYANVVVCGMFLLYAMDRKGLSANRAIAGTVMMWGMLYAVTLSGSRYPMLVAGLLAVASLTKRFTNWRHAVALAGVVLLLLAVVAARVETLEIMSVWRFEEDSGGRLEKLLMPLQILSENLQHFLIGASSELVEATVSPDGVGISDNSYMLFALSVGVPYAVVWFGSFILLLWGNTSDVTSRVFMLYMLGCLGLTNAILWEPWIFIAILTSALLGRMDTNRQPAVANWQGREYDNCENGICRA